MPPVTKKRKTTTTPDSLELLLGLFFIPDLAHLIREYTEPLIQGHLIQQWSISNTDDMLQGRPVQQWLNRMEGMRELLLRGKYRMSDDELFFIKIFKIEDNIPCKLRKGPIVCADQFWAIAVSDGGLVQVAHRSTGSLQCCKQILKSFDARRDLVALFDEEIFTCCQSSYHTRVWSVPNLVSIRILEMPASPESFLVFGRYLYTSTLSSVTAIDKWSGKVEREWDISAFASSTNRQLAIHENALFIRFDDQICKFN